MFERVQEAPRDAILGLSEAFREDPNPDKINLTAGVYQDASGTTPVLECVRVAEQRLAAKIATARLPVLHIAGSSRLALSDALAA